MIVKCHGCLSDEYIDLEKDEYVEDYLEDQGGTIYFCSEVCRMGFLDGYYYEHDE